MVRPFGGSPIRLAAGMSLTAEPPASGFLEWEGSPYRGSFTVFRSGDGVTVVNRANLEEYLFGVVPRELPPDLFPELEALKAQALAARTYALTPRDAYLRRGYDLCAGPACQVYGGVAAEHPLSTAAIRETAGEAIFHDGRLIDALYTAACGGHTENAENVFSNPTPYLVARACIREAGGVRLEGGPADGPLDAALVRLAGAPVSGWSGAGLSAPATREEAAGVVSAAVRWLGLSSCEPDGAPGGELPLGAFGRLVEEIRCREPGTPALGPGPDGGELAREGDPALGRLLAEGLLDPSERGLDPARPVSRREVIGVAASLLRRDGRLFRRGQIREVAVLDGWVRINAGRRRERDRARRAAADPARIGRRRAPLPGDPSHPHAGPRRSAAARGARRRAAAPRRGLRALSRRREPGAGRTRPVRPADPGRPRRRRGPLLPAEFVVRSEEQRRSLGGGERSEAHRPDRRPRAAGVRRLGPDRAPRDRRDRPGVSNCGGCASGACWGSPRTSSGRNPGATKPAA